MYNNYFVHPKTLPARFLPLQVLQGSESLNLYKKFVWNWRKSSGVSASSPIEDRISSLPDDLINTILSFLSVRDAAITCALSKCWRNHWKHRLAIELTSPRHARGGINLLPGLHELIIVGNFKDWSEESQLQQLLGDAFSKGVPRLELFLYVEDRCTRRGDNTRRNLIPLPPAFCERGNSCKHVSLSHVRLNVPYGYNVRLKELYLYRCQVSDQALESTISNSTVLERLTLIELIELARPSIQSPVLKELVIFDCKVSSKELHINAPNLLQLRASRLLGKVTLTNCHRLERAMFTCHEYRYREVSKILADELRFRKVKELMHQIHDQLSFLRIDSDFIDLWHGFDYEMKLTYSFWKLEVLRVDDYLSINNSALISFINNCPRLSTLEFSLFRCNDTVGRPLTIDRWLGREEEIITCEDFNDFLEYSPESPEVIGRSWKKDVFRAPEGYEPLQRIKTLVLHKLGGYCHEMEGIHTLLSITPNLESFYLSDEIRWEPFVLKTSFRCPCREVRAQLLEFVTLLPRASAHVQFSLL